MIQVLFEDTNWIFVNKPSGLIVHRSARTKNEPALLQMLRDQIGRRVYPIHRLDGGTSGVIGLGLNSEGAKLLQDALLNPKTIKKYYALVRGHTPESFIVEKPLKDESGKSQEARTEFKTIESCNYCSLVEATIKSGRMHQIRRHLSSLTHHVLGDRSYGKSGLNDFYLENYGLTRLFLHSHKLELYRGENLESLIIKAPLPDLLLKVIHKLCSEGLFKAEKLPLDLRPQA